MITLLILVVVLGLIIFVHEAGHYFAAKKLGATVEEFEQLLLESVRFICSRLTDPSQLPLSVKKRLMRGWAEGLVWD